MGVGGEPKQADGDVPRIPEQLEAEVEVVEPLAERHGTGPGPLQDGDGGLGPAPAPLLVVQLQRQAVVLPGRRHELRQAGRQAEWLVEIIGMRTSSACHTAASDLTCALDSSSASLRCWMALNRCRRGRDGSAIASARSSRLRTAAEWSNAISSRSMTACTCIASHARREGWQAAMSSVRADGERP